MRRKLSLSFKKKKTDNVEPFIDPGPLDSGRLRENAELEPSTTRSINRIAEDVFIDSTIPESPRVSDRYTRRRHNRPSRNEHRVVPSSPPISWVPHTLGNVLPRYGHMVNVAGGKSDEIYLFGGKQRDQIMGDFYRINTGTAETKSSLFTSRNTRSDSIDRQWNRPVCVVDGRLGALRE